MTEERTPPHDLDAERYVLGSMILSARAVDDVTDILGGSEFYRPAHETVYRTVTALHADGPVDLERVKASLQAQGELARCGGVVGLLELTQVANAPSSAAYHARTVADRAGRRRIITAGTRITQIAYGSGDVPIDQIHEDARAEIDTATGSTSATSSVTAEHALDLMLTAMDTDVELYPTPWSEMNHLLGGFAPGRTYIVGARPGVGKTVACLQAAVHHAHTHQQAVLYVTLEMSVEELMMRATSLFANVPHKHLETRALTADDRARIDRHGADLRAMPLRLSDRAAMRITDIRREARTISRTERLGMVVVDYVGLVTAPSNSRVPRHEVVAQFSRALKLLAREMHVPVLIAAQINREAQGNVDRMPGLHNLRESGGLEQDADAVLLLHRDSGEREGDDPFKLRIGLAKHRHGPTGALTLEFEGAYQRAVDERWSPSRGLGNAS